jgi:DNA-binding response OmpR family regulator
MNSERIRSHVLIVEDESWIRELWIEELEEDGAQFTVTAVASARAALPVLAAGGLLAAIIDIGLPEMSGEALIQVARRADPLLPILAVTGFDAGHYQHLADQHVRVLQKPFRTSWLLLNLKALLARRPRQSCGNSSVLSV